MSAPRDIAEEREEGYLYHILNLSRGASVNEVHERYRTLSLVFHPDKQQDSQAKEVATRNFLKIQKAYQVLSDPFLREVYDQLGDEGLKTQWSEEFRSRPLHEVRDKILDLKSELRQTRLNKVLSPKGTLHCVVNATPLFGENGSLWSRASRVNFAGYSLRHDLQKKIGDKTALGLGVQVRSRANRLDFVGTVRHQFSPRISSLAQVNLGFPFYTRLEGSYQDGTNSLIVKLVGSLVTPILVPPALNVALTRKLFRQRNEQASINLHVGQRPHVKLRLTSPTPFGLSSIEDRHEGSEPGVSHSLSGLETGITFSSYGLDLEKGDPKLVGEFGIDLLELGTTLKAGLTLGLTGINWVLSAVWSIPSKSFEVSAMTTIGSAGVVLVLELSHLEQRLNVPIVLSAVSNGTLVVCTTILPSIAGVLLYRFVILPRRRNHRLARLRAARKRLEESEERRERNAVENLLRDLARRHNQTEKAKQGLVILEASYGPIEKEDEGNQDINLDVAIPLQALIRNSQLFIQEGEESKLNLQGFFDPAPSVPKLLRIRYLFREYMHYAEIPDYMPTVLPLLEHRVVE